MILPAPEGGGYNKNVRDGEVSSALNRYVALLVDAINLSGLE